MRPDPVPSGVSIDSRTLRRGELFVAIVGRVHDGHEHVRAAFAAGAAAAVVQDRALAEALAGEGRGVVLVEDTTRALQDLAAAARRESGATVVAITGSAGKTTTKDLTRLLLEGSRPTHASRGNLNNHYGLPLALLAMPPGTQACVLEMGVSTPGEMDRLLEVAAPDVGLVTIIGTAHVGNFESQDALAEEKMKVPRACALALLNSDDPRQWSRRAGVAGRIVAWGSGPEARDVRLVGMEPRGLEGSRLGIESAAGRLALECPLPGAHQARNLLAATAVALTLGVPPEIIAAQAARAMPGAHRGELHRAGGVTVVDDTYNANPAAMAAAMDLLAQAPCQGRRILVAGDMLELGAQAAAEHEAVGRRAAAGGVDLLLGVGPDSARAVAAARDGGLPAEHVEDARTAGHRLAAIVRPGDLVLLKASRGIGLDAAVALLLEDLHAGRRA